jgi:phosphoglycerate kinase
LLEEEIKSLSQALTPPKGSLAILGGAKFETKIPLVEKLLQMYERVLLGGALADDLLKSRGMPVGSSLVSTTPVPKAIASNERLEAPLDVALLDEKTNMGRTTYTADVRIGEKIVDIGPLTIEKWSTEVREAPFVLFNGPLGKYEDGFVEGTEALARALVEGKAHAVVGGGDTEAALSKFPFDTSRIFVSTGGGAMLEFLTHGALPGIAALSK